MKGKESAAGIAIRYGLDGPGIESRLWARFSAPVHTGPGAHPASYTVGSGSFQGIKRSAGGVDHPPPPEVKERVEILLLLSWAFVACSGENFTFTNGFS